MTSYRYDSIVNKQEADALKEMIFKRARERAEAINKESQTSVSESVKDEVMSLARYSFIEQKNPFNSIKAQAVESSQVKSETNSIDSSESEGSREIQAKEIEVHKRRIEEIKSSIVVKNRDIQDNAINQTVEATMKEARAGLENKQTFMGALNFLNSQATISLIKSKGAKFEAIV